MIERARYDELIAIAPVMFHVTAARNVSDILRDGLRPGSDIGISTLDNFFRTRRDHVYLIRQREVPIVDVEDPRVIAVDIAALDHRLVDPDEDTVAEKFPEMVSIEPPMRALNGSGEEEPGRVGARRLGGHYAGIRPERGDGALDQGGSAGISGCDPAWRVAGGDDPVPIDLGLCEGFAR